MNAEGIDVSHHNGAVDWQRAARDGISFALLRVSYGRSGVDTRFREHYRGARAAGLAVGAYHYSYALTPQQAAQEAVHCLRQLQGYPLDLPLFLDMEDADGYKQRSGFVFDRPHLNAICAAFWEQTDRAGQRCGLYANRDWLTRLLDVPANRPVWLAQWAKQPTYSGPFAVWQYTDRGQVDGVRGVVDRDRAALEELMGKEADTMIRYRMPEDVPDWARQTVDKLVRSGWIRPEPDGSVDLSHDLVRMLVINDRAGLYPSDRA